MLDSDRASHSPSLPFSKMPSPSAPVSRFLRGGVDGAWVHIWLLRGLCTPPPPPFAPSRSSRRDAVTPVEQTQGRLTKTSKAPFLKHTCLASRDRCLLAGECVGAQVCVCKAPICNPISCERVGMCAPPVRMRLTWASKLTVDEQACRRAGSAKQLQRRHPSRGGVSHACAIECCSLPAFLLSRHSPPICPKFAASPVHALNNSASSPAGLSAPARCVGYQRC